MATCDVCAVQRTTEPDYNPADLIIRGKVGWYSGDDGEICPNDMVALLKRGNGQ